MKVNVNQDACVGCGACVSICPDIFSFNDDGLAEAITKDVQAEDEDKILDAVESCPTEAISKIND